MKKLLTILSAIGMTATASSAVVSCGRMVSNNITAQQKDISLSFDDLHKQISDGKWNGATIGISNVAYAQNPALGFNKKALLDAGVKTIKIQLGLTYYETVNGDTESEDKTIEIRVNDMNGKNYQELKSVGNYNNGDLGAKMEISIKYSGEILLREWIVDGNWSASEKYGISASQKSITYWNGDKQIELSNK